MWMVTVYRRTDSPCGAQSAFIKWTEWTLAMALPLWQHYQLIIIIIILLGRIACMQCIDTYIHRYIRVCCIAHINSIESLCGLLLQMSPHVAWAVCLCIFLTVCWPRVSCAKTAELIKMLFFWGVRGGVTHMVPRNHVLDGGPQGKGHFRGGHLPAHCNVPTDECIAHCSPAARANVPAQRPRLTNAFAASRGDKTRRRCGLLSNYFGHLLLLLYSTIASPYCKENVKSYIHCLVAT